MYAFLPICKYILFRKICSILLKIPTTQFDFKTFVVMFRMQQ
jgi:hypothetical protein